MDIKAKAITAMSSIHENVHENSFIVEVGQGATTEAPKAPNHHQHHQHLQILHN